MSNVKYVYEFMVEFSLQTSGEADVLSAPARVRRQKREVVHRVRVQPRHVRAHWTRGVGAQIVRRRQRPRVRPRTGRQVTATLPFPGEALPRPHGASKCR